VCGMSALYGCVDSKVSALGAYCMHATRHGKHRSLIAAADVYNKY